MLKNIEDKLIDFFKSEKNSLYTILILAFIFAASFFYSFSKNKKINQAFQTYQTLETTCINSLEYRKKILDFLQKKTVFDPYFIDNHLESITLLQNEKSKLENIGKHPLFSNSDSLKRRLKYLSGKDNKIKFIEENIKESSLVKETDEILQNQIEIDLSDLKKILSIIENRKIDEFIPIESSPQLIIKYFDLKKEKDSSFSLDLKLLKREFTKKKS
ncbi:MAG: hypothetical protein JXA94_05960 [Parachlamydiales bacterium]|nr:hypothetical protein [Parachlamydiales bacterium]